MYIGNGFCASAAGVRECPRITGNCRESNALDVHEQRAELLPRRFRIDGYFGNRVGNFDAK